MSSTRISVVSGDEVASHAPPITEEANLSHLTHRRSETSKKLGHAPSSPKPHHALRPTPGIGADAVIDDG
jgi:hypothetical protein